MKTIELMRYHFITNSLGENEFDWYLSELGIPEDKREKISSITIEVLDFETCEA